MGAPFPHCDSRILHIPKSCWACDLYPAAQQSRIENNIAFTDDPEPEGKKPCPAMGARPETYKSWPNNRAQKERPQ